MDLKLPEQRGKSPPMFYPFHNQFGLASQDFFYKELTEF